MSALPHGRGDGPTAYQAGPYAWPSSPRAWGWSDSPFVQGKTIALFPTGVGMVRRSGPARRGECPLPHGRGDGPTTYWWKCQGRCSSPRAWGWSVDACQAGAGCLLFPTGVGMVRHRCLLSRSLSPLPHGRGDGPCTTAANFQNSTSSPRAWGWSAGQQGGRYPRHLFPTGVGMVRPLTVLRPLQRALPHGRGDGPSNDPVHELGSASSPRAWGWSESVEFFLREHGLFPTGVGMVRVRPGLISGFQSLPHGRGDGPS